ncbi:hypothetical protein CYMTET_6048 [Cymbomonas tetramitiformis]|uniref:Integrase catalytic domain-containing protein n=1 Tax=Cymbomonas tetramitiformis TaxID=36881 RepID=A0AAE0LIG5_9CHLO|nr:hypothetical protein CYMTET_6048 [Cymbomonas tetramitiformis]
MNFGDRSAATVARIYFGTVWRQHGAPMKIVSDRDPRFLDAFWKDLMRLTTPYNPRSDGQRAEHTNRVVEGMLRSFVDGNPEDWDLYSTNVEFAINDSLAQWRNRKLSKRWHVPLAVTERFYSGMQAGLPEADGGAPVAYPLQLPPRWRIHDVFAQHRLKPYVGGADAFASRRQPAIPEAVIVDGQREAHVDHILARRLRSSRGKEIVEWKVR